MKLTLSSTGWHSLSASGATHSGDDALRNFDRYLEARDLAETQLVVLRPDDPDEAERLIRAAFKECRASHLLRPAMDPFRRAKGRARVEREFAPERRTMRPVGMNHKAIRAVVSRFYPPRGYERQDLLAAAAYAYIRAGETYDPRCGATEATWANLLMSRELIDLVRRAHSADEDELKKVYSFDAHVKRRVDNSLGDITYGELLPDFTLDGEDDSVTRAVIDRETYAERLAAFRQILSAFEFSVLDMLIAGFDVEAIALGLNRSEKAIHNALRRVRTKTRPLLFEDAETETEAIAA